jgi:hypothetical protein
MGLAESAEVQTEVCFLLEPAAYFGLPCPAFDLLLGPGHQAASIMFPAYTHLAPRAVQDVPRYRARGEEFRFSGNVDGTVVSMFDNRLSVVFSEKLSADVEGRAFEVAKRFVSDFYFLTGKWVTWRYLGPFRLVENEQPQPLNKVHTHQSSSIHVWSTSQLMSSMAGGAICLQQRDTRYVRALEYLYHGGFLEHSMAKFEEYGLAAQHDLMASSCFLARYKAIETIIGAPHKDKDRQNRINQLSKAAVEDGVDSAGTLPGRLKALTDFRNDDDIGHYSVEKPAKAVAMKDRLVEVRSVATVVLRAYDSHIRRTGGGFPVKPARKRAGPSG